MPEARVIRRATIGDATTLARIHAVCFSEAWSPAEMTKWLEMPSIVAIAAVERGGATGFVLGQAAADQAEILTLAVEPARQRQGIGGALLQTLEGEAAKRGARSLYLDVAEDNAAALALYRGAGFAEISRRRGYYAGPSGPRDAIVMMKSLRID